MKNILFLMFCLPVLIFGQQNGQVTDIRKDKRLENDLFNFLDARITTGYNIESDLTFRFSKGTFPDLELNSPATARKFLGDDYSIKVRWFDGDMKEVDKPVSPGRYAYYAEITGKNGIVMRRAATLFCTPNEWQGWTEQIRADMKYFPFDSIPESIWTENKEPISNYAGQIILKSMLNNEDGSVLLSFIHDMYRKKLEPGPMNTPVIMDGDYHVRLKQKILGTENKYREFVPPQKLSVEAQTLQPLSKKDKAKNADFEKQLNDLCKEWAEISGETFAMLVAKEGNVLFHNAFGENLRGKFTIAEPAEIASITKLYTGLLFAQFVDQGIIHIDDYVGKFLPGFDTTGDKAITLRQCFTHTTGFYGHGSFGGVQNPWLDNSLSLWIPYIPVGTYHWYNGMGYNLAGKVMEITSGKSIFHLMKEYLFNPLQLKNTTLDIDLAYGIKTTAYDMAVVGQMILNKGRYGNLQFFSEETYNALLPVKLETYFPKIKNIEWGIGMTFMNIYIKDEKTGVKRAILSDKIIGHGSATSSILRVDPKNQIVITQSRMNGGKLYYEYLTKAMLLIEKYLVKK